MYETIERAIHDLNGYIDELSRAQIEVKSAEEKEAVAARISAVQSTQERLRLMDTSWGSWESRNEKLQAIYKLLRTAVDADAPHGDALVLAQMIVDELLRLLQVATETTYDQWKDWYEVYHEDGVDGLWGALALAWMHQEGDYRSDIEPVFESDLDRSDNFGLIYVTESNCIFTKTWDVWHDMPKLFTELGWHKKPLPQKSEWVAGSHAEFVAEQKPEKFESYWVQHGDGFSEVDRLLCDGCEVTAGDPVQVITPTGTEVRDLDGVGKIPSGTTATILELREYTHTDAVVVKTSEGEFVVDVAYILCTRIEI